MIDIPYFDYMATTPVDERVIEKMLPYLGLSGAFGNPAAVSHAYGRLALEAVERARVQVAEAIAAMPSEIIFTSGATEANHLALRGAAHFYQRKGRHIISMQTEHPSVLGALSQLEQEGFQVTYLAPEANGILNVDTLARALTDQTILVSLMHVNNEIGVIQPIEAVSELLVGRGVLLHVDAAQSVGKIPVNVTSLGVDLMSLSAHKNYGPKGVGALYLRRRPRVRLMPLLLGGGQEQGLRPGTVPTHQVVGMGEALSLGESLRLSEMTRVRQLRDHLWEGICTMPGIQLNGDWIQRVAHNLHVSLPSMTPEKREALSAKLAISAGSACATMREQPSYVLKALGLSDKLSVSAMRFSLGRFSCEADVQKAIVLLKSEAIL